MDIEKMIAFLEEKDTAAGYEVLKQLEEMSEKTDALYKYIDKFAEMTRSDKYVVRVRGFRLFCKQARWDSKDYINKNFSVLLPVLNDEKPTAVRMALSAITDIVIYKPELSKMVEKAVVSIKYENYKESMQSLIVKDIRKVVQLINEKCKNI